MLSRLAYLVVGLVLLVLLVVALAFALPFISDLDEVKRVALQRVETELGTRVDVGALHLRVFPRVELQLHDVAIPGPPSDDPTFSAARVVAVVRMRPLLSRHVVVDQIFIERPRVVLHRDEAGNWVIPALSKPGAPQSGPTTDSSEPPLMPILNARLINGEVILQDRFGQDEAMRLRVSGIQADVSLDGHSHGVRFNVSGAVPDDSFAGTLQVDGVITPLEHAGETADARFQGEGHVVIGNINVGYVMSFFARQPLSSQSPGRANIGASFSMAPATTGYKLMLSRVRAELGHVSFHGQGAVEGLSNGEPTFAIRLASSPITVDEIVRWVPPGRLPPQVKSLVTEREFAGTVEVLHAEASGVLGTEPRIDLTGEFRLSQVQLLGPGGTLGRKFSGIILLDGDQVTGRELRGEYGPIVISDGTATIVNLTYEPRLNLTLKADAPARDLTEFVDTTFSSLPGIRGLKSISDVQGNVSGTFEITGPLSRPTEITIVKGEINVEDLGFHTALLPWPVHHMSGRIRLNGFDIEWIVLDGRVGNSRLALHGAVWTGEMIAFDRFSVRASVNLADMMELFPEEHASLITLQGSVDIDAALSGSPGSPRLKGTVDFERAGVDVTNVFHKSRGKPAVLAFETDLTNGSMLRISKADLQILQSHLMATGIIHFRRKPRFEATLRAKRVSLTNLSQSISLGPLREGIMAVSLDLHGEGPDWRSWGVMGEATLEHGVLASEALAHELTNISLRIKTVNQRIEIEQFAFKTGNSNLAAIGTIADWRATPSITLQIRSSQLDLALLLPRPQQHTEDARAGGREGPTGLPDIDVDLRIDHAYYKRFLLTDLSCHLVMKENMLQVERLSAATDEGHMDGHALIPLSRVGMGRASLRVSGIPVERVFSAFGLEEPPLTGWLTLNAELQQEGELSDPLTTLRSLQDIDVLIEEGHIKKLKSVSKILTLLNLPSLLQGKTDLAKDGLPFDRISLIVALDRGLLTAKKILIDGPILEIGGAGRHDLIQDDLDIVLAVSPVASYAKLLRKIPLLGRLTAGEGPKLDAALFSVKGSRTDPSVNYMPLEQLSSVLTGTTALAINVLKNALTLPFDILTPKRTAPSRPGTP